MPKLQLWSQSLPTAVFRGWNVPSTWRFTPRTVVRNISSRCLRILPWLVHIAVENSPSTAKKTSCESSFWLIPVLADYGKAVIKRITAQAVLARRSRSIGVLYPNSPTF